MLPLIHLQILKISNLLILQYKLINLMLKEQVPKDKLINKNNHHTTFSDCELNFYLHIFSRLMQFLREAQKLH